jgi:hypothetical protein
MLSSLYRFDLRKLASDKAYWMYNAHIMEMGCMTYMKLKIVS